MSMAHHRSAAAALQNIVAGPENIHAGTRNIAARRPGRLKASDSPLARRRLADKEECGPALQAAMLLDGLDQGQLAVACGRDQGAVSRWHSPTSPDVPTMLDIRWAKLAGLKHWPKAAARIALASSPLDDDTRETLVQMRDAALAQVAALDALLGASE